MSIKRWNNISGNCLVSGTYCGDSETIEPEMGDDWSEEIITVIANAAANKYALEPGDEIELLIDFLSSGYEDPGKITGPPEDCYPPEGEDEREVENACVRHYRDGEFLQELGLPETIYGYVFDQFETTINETEIERD